MKSGHFINILVYLYMARVRMQKKYFGFFLGITAFLLIILFTDVKVQVM